MRKAMMGHSIRMLHALIMGGLLLCATLIYTEAIFSQAAETGQVNRTANLRSGPGTGYAVIGQAAQDQSVTIAGANEDGSWLQLSTGAWIAAFLVDRGTSAPAPTAAASTGATAIRNANLRAGPGTGYAVIGGVRSGQPLTVTGANADGTWLQLADGVWIAAFLVNQSAGATADPSTTVAQPAATPTPASAPPAEAGPAFVVIEKRLWDPYENGGSLDGPSVHCGQGRALIVNVVDANGNRLNGVAVQAQLGARETYVTGAQGKGDGVAEFVLGGGQDVAVLRDNDGSPATSEVATGMSTNPQAIPFETLIAANYCQDEASCRHFAENNSCNGHFSWTVTFQRRR
jgi:uncharacterized protein YraI